MPDIGFKIDFPISMPDVFLSSARLILHSDPKFKNPFGNCWENTFCSQQVCKSQQLVFRYQSCSDILREHTVLVIEKTFKVQG